MNRVSVFKYIIKEFHEFKLPDIIPRVLELPKTNKIISLVGSRRVGKTFYFYQIINTLLNKGVEKDSIL